MEFVAICLHRPVSLTAGAARVLAGYARRRQGRESWRVMSAEAFTVPGVETLVLTRPSAGVEARFAGYFYPVLRKYFTN